MAKETTYEEIARNLKNRVYSPVYYLMGEESYYIDRILDYLLQTVLTEEEKEFNLTVLYGPDVDMSTIINAAKRYPMMSKYQLVVVKEAQHVKNMEELVFYLQQPQPSTILVICHKNGSLDKRKKLAVAIEKTGVLFDSKRVRESQLGSFISSYLKRKRVDIEPKAVEMMSEFVGTDLSRMASELDKLVLTLPTGQTRVTPQQIEDNIGVSKDYNNFELKNALIYKDVLKANKIVKYFSENPKTNPLQVTLGILFSFFSNLMLAYYAPQKSEQGIAQQLQLKQSWQAREYMEAMRRYSGVKVMRIIGDIRYCDARSKGIDNVSTGTDELLRELIFKILH